MWFLAFVHTVDCIYWFGKALSYTYGKTKPLLSLSYRAAALPRNIHRPRMSCFAGDTRSPSTVHFHTGTDGWRRQTSGWRSRGEKQSLSHAAWRSVISLSGCQECLSQSAVEPVAVINDGMLEGARESRRREEKDEHLTQSAPFQRETSRVRLMDSSRYSSNPEKSGLETLHRQVTRVNTTV